VANKGSPFERLVCRQLTAWWTGDPEADVVFWRTSQSGGRATARKRKGKKTGQAHCGDITALTDDARPLTDLITWELKRGYSRTGARATITDLMDRPAHAARSQFEQWVEQAWLAKKAAGTPFWAVVHQRDKRDSLIWLPKRLVEDFIDLKNEFVPPICECTAVTDIEGKPRASIRIVGMRFDDFLASIQPRHVRTLARWYQENR